MISTAHLKIPPSPVSPRPITAKADLPRQISIRPPCVLVPTSEAAPVSAPLRTELSEEEFDALKADIQKVLDDSAKVNANERLVNLINVCIDGGVNTAGWIIAVAESFRFKRGHVGSVLTSSAVGRSKTPLWRCDQEGRYSLQT